MSEAAPVSTGQLSDAVARVEAELTAFWSTPDETHGEPMAKVRAATLNYVAIGSMGDVDTLRRSADDLAEVHAGRTFLLTVDPKLAPWEIATDVGAVCRIGGDVHICYDRVELCFGAMAATRAASVVSSLALSEVPTVVELGASAPASLSDAMIKVADRVVVDSSHTPLDRLAAVAKATKAPIADRAFVRTFSWRDLIARFFDAQPAWARMIRSVALDVRPPDAGGSAPAARLLVGWLASRLGWRLEGPQQATDAQGDRIVIAVGAEARPDLAPGDLASVRFVVVERTPTGDRRVQLSCERTTAGAVRWTIATAGADSRSGGPLAVEHEHRFGFRDEAWVLTKAIDSTEGDRVYREALLVAAGWGGR